jgi:F0F1-type ATP synthase epsilon subunit
MFIILIAKMRFINISVGLLEIENDDVDLMAARASRLETLYLKLKMDVQTSTTRYGHAPNLFINLIKFSFH